MFSVTDSFSCRDKKQGVSHKRQFFILQLISLQGRNLKYVQSMYRPAGITEDKNQAKTAGAHKSDSVLDKGSL